MRILLRKAKRPHRLVRGGHVIELQKGLGLTGHLIGSVDGIFGGDTERGVQRWQMAIGRPGTGEVDALDWRGITQSEPPSLFRRCLALTAAFEGHGYTLAAGNWDNAYLTWGVVGFTLRHGNLGKVIERVAARHPGLIEQTIGKSKTAELLRIVRASKTEQREWANAISLPPRGYKLRADWADAFEALGFRAEVRAVQDEVARDVYFDRAIRDHTRFGLEDELDLGLCFDTAVQNGGINDEKARLFEKAMRAEPGATGARRRTILAQAIADGSNPRFRQDVLDRRLTFADGTGNVHGAAYLLEDWGLIAEKVPPLELATSIAVG